jgi:hypothetical protein
LNENPDTNIDQLIQQTTNANTIASLPLTLLPSTTKPWTEVLNYDPISHEKPKHTTYKKRKSDQLATEFKTSESIRKRRRERYYNNRDDILDKKQLQYKNKQNNNTNSHNSQINSDNSLTHPDPLPIAHTNTITTTTTIDTNNKLLYNTKETSKHTTTSTITDYFKKKITPKDDKKPP